MGMTDVTDGNIAISRCGMSSTNIFRVTDVGESYFVEARRDKDKGKLIHELRKRQKKCRGNRIRIEENRE